MLRGYKVRLTYTQGSSDKEYIATLDELDFSNKFVGWQVVCSWGRRGTLLTSKTFPFDTSAQASYFWRSKIQEKIREGYIVVESDCAEFRVVARSETTAGRAELIAARAELIAARAQRRIAPRRIRKATPKKGAEQVVEPIQKIRRIELE